MACEPAFGQVADAGSGWDVPLTICTLLTHRGATPVPQINRQMSLVGAISITGYQIVFTWPRREELVIRKVRDSGLSVSQVVGLYVAFGAAYTLHSFVQGKVLARKTGVVSLGIINAMRTVVISVASAALFCRHGAASQCMTPISGTSALVVSAGALLWATAPSDKRLQAVRPVVKSRHAEKQD